MSTRYNNGSHYENHQRAAELHDVAAHAHRVAEQQHGKQEHLSGHEHSRHAFEHSEQAYEHTQETALRHGVQTFGHAEIAALAYELWRERGSSEGSADEDWYHAAAILRSRIPPR